MRRSEIEDQAIGDLVAGIEQLPARAPSVVVEQTRARHRVVDPAIALVEIKRHAIGELVVDDRPGDIQLFDDVAVIGESGLDRRLALERRQSRLITTLPTVVFLPPVTLCGPSNNSNDWRSTKSADWKPMCL